MKSLAADENSQTTVLRPHLEGTAGKSRTQQFSDLRKKAHLTQGPQDEIFLFIPCSLVTVFFLAPSKGMELNV